MMMTEIDSIGAFGLRVVCVYLCVRTSVCLAPVVHFLLPWYSSLRPRVRK